MTDRKLLRIGEVAVILDVPIARAYDLARSGSLPIVRLGRQLRVHPQVLDEWMRAGGSKASDERVSAA